MIEINWLSFVGMIISVILVFLNGTRAFLFKPQTEIIYKEIPPITKPLDWGIISDWHPMISYRRVGENLEVYSEERSLSSSNWISILCNAFMHLDKDINTLFVYPDGKKATVRIKGWTTR